MITLSILLISKEEKEMSDLNTNINELSNLFETWKQEQDNLRKLIRAQKNFDVAMDLAIKQHGLIHFKEVSGCQEDTHLDKLWKILDENDLTAMPFKENKNIMYKRTILHHIWHITRIEDIVSNLLIGECSEILNDQWQEKLNISIRDTGNAMTDEEIIEFSQQIDVNELINYRNVVGKRTIEIIKNLTVADLKKRPTEEALEQIMINGGLTMDKQSYWLKDFWGSYTFTGLILLPLTNHHLMHLKDCLQLKVELNG